MRSSFAARRKARVVGADDAGGDVPPAGDSSDEQGKHAPAMPASSKSNNLSSSSPLTVLAETTPVVKRPTIASRASSKKSSLRLSFNPGEAPTASLDSSTASEVFTPKKSNLSRRAIERNALRKSLGPPSTSHLPLRPPDDRPSYTASSLSELRNSTPSTPKDLQSLSDTETETEHSSALDIASKFDSSLTPQAPASSIPTESEIREKKDRRARLAREQDFIHLSSPPTTNSISLLPPKKVPDSRLAPDDETLLEDCDDFVSDGPLPLGRQAQKAHRHRHALEIRDLIQSAQPASDSPDSDSDSEADRHAAYEAAQTRAGMDGLHKPRPASGPRRPKTPPRITPLPQLGACLERLQSTLRRVQESRAGKVRQAEVVEREMAEIAAREVEIRRLLAEAGEAYERLRVEAGGGPRGEEGREGVVERGLDSLGHAATGVVSGGEG